MIRSIAGPAIFALPLCLIISAQTATRQPATGTAAGEWPGYGGEKGFQRYSPLDLINKNNVRTPPRTSS
jgi:glucose dehydrogenase